MNLLRALFDELPQAIVVVDRDGHIVWSNKAFGRRALALAGIVVFEARDLLPAARIRAAAAESAAQRRTAPRAATRGGLKRARRRNARREA